MSHVKGTAGICIQQNRIATAAHKKRMRLIGIFGVRRERILLPAVQQLPALVQISKFLSKSPERLIRIEMHRLMDPAAVALSVTMPADRKAFPAVVHVRVKDLFLRQELPVLIDGHFPVIFTKTQRQVSGTKLTEMLLLAKLRVYPPLWRKDRITRPFRVYLRNHLQPEHGIRQKTDLHLRPIPPVCLYSNPQDALLHSKRDRLQKEIIMILKNSSAIPYLWIIIYLHKPAS